MERPILCTSTMIKENSGSLSTSLHDTSLCSSPDFKEDSHAKNILHYFFCDFVWGILEKN